MDQKAKIIAGINGIFASLFLSSFKIANHIIHKILLKITNIIKNRKM